METPTYQAIPDAGVALSEVVAALSHALDLTEGQPRGHAGRTCAIGMRVARAIDLDDDQRASLYYALLLKDAGCSSSAARMTEIFGDVDDLALKQAGKLVDFSKPSEALRFVRDHTSATGGPLAHAREVIMTAVRFARAGGEIVEARCDRGARIVAGLGFSAEAADAVRALDEHWDGSGRPGKLTGDQIPLLARIACLAQTIDVFLTAYGRDAARQMVRDRRGRWFDPDLADAFLSIPAGDGLWGDLASADEPGLVACMEPGGTLRIAGDDDLDRIAEAFAQVIDAKSPYTFNHSTGVAAFAVAVGRELGLDDDAVRSLRRAALLHDIGKLGVPNAILDKPSKLSDEEFATIRRHPSHTVEILARVGAFAPIAFVAGAHHERIDGRGYHLGLVGDEIPLAARILAVADVFEAMHADRPYRDGMPVERILGIMRGDVGTAFDGDCVVALEHAIETRPDELPVRLPA